MLLPGRMEVTLRPMTPEEFTAYADHSIRAFAQEAPQYQSLPREQALTLVAEEFWQIVPEGLKTPGHFLLTIQHQGKNVGFLHLGPQKNQPTRAFAWDFEIYEPYRNQGLGRAAMQAAIPLLKAAGITRVGLNVFGNNTRARTLYESMGFQVTQMQMARDL